jgi:hypothetical protein
VGADNSCRAAARERSARAWFTRIGASGRPR